MHWPVTRSRFGRTTPENRIEDRRYADRSMGSAPVWLLTLPQSSDRGSRNGLDVMLFRWGCYFGRVGCFAPWIIDGAGDADATNDLIVLLIQICLAFFTKVCIETATDIPQANSRLRLEQFRITWLQLPPIGHRKVKSSIFYIGPDMVVDLLLEIRAMLDGIFNQGLKNPATF